MTAATISVTPLILSGLGAFGKDGGRIGMSADTAHAVSCKDVNANCALFSVLPGDVDPRAKTAQKALVESRGSPEAVMRHLITDKNDTPVSDEVKTKL